MFIDPMSLLDQTVENLALLAEFFADHLDERTHDRRQVTPEAHKAREALVAARIAIAKLQAVRSQQLQRPLLEPRLS